MEQDLNNRLATFKTTLENIVNNYAKDILIPYMNSEQTDERYEKIRSIFSTIAIAQWYKQKTKSNATLPYANITDTQNLENIGRTGTFNRSYWNSQASQIIVRKACT
jgi:hypothetical protein